MIQLAMAASYHMNQSIGLPSASEGAKGNMTKTENKRAMMCIIVSADSPEKLRPCDAWRVYDFAMENGCVALVSELLKERNAPAYRAFLEYERELFNERQLELEREPRKEI